MIENYILFVSLLVSDSEATQIFKYKGFLVFDTALRMYKHYEYVACSIKAAWHPKLFLQKIPQKTHCEKNEVKIRHHAMMCHNLQGVQTQWSWEVENEPFNKADF